VEVVFVLFAGVFVVKKIKGNTVSETFHLLLTIVVLKFCAESLVTYNTSTPANGTNTSSTTLFVNVSIIEQNRDATLVDIDGTNYTMTCTGTAPDLTCNFTISSLSDGSHNFKVFVNDSAKNVNETERRFITVDTIAPFVDYTGLTTANGTNVSRDYIYVNVTSSDPTTGVANLTFILVNSTAEINRTFISTGLPNVTLNFTSLADGIYTYNVTASDYLGNKNTTERRTIIIDTTKPLIDYVDPTQINATNLTVTNIEVNVTITEVNFANYTFILVNLTNGFETELNRTFVIDETATLLTFTNLLNGTYLYNVTITDAAGNKNTAERRTIYVNTTVTTDTLPPYITFISPTPANASNQSSTTVTINTTVFDASSNVGSCYVSWAAVGNVFLNNTMTKTANDGSNSNVTCNYTQTSLADDTYIYKVIVNDTVSNGNQSNVQQVTVDSIAPFIDYTGLTAANGTNVSTNYIYVNVTTDDVTTEVANLTFTLVNITSGLTTELNRTFVNAQNYTFNFTSLADGTYMYNVTATDHAGNKNTTERRTITLDTTFPLIDYETDTLANNSINNIDYITVNVTITETNFVNFTFILSNLTAEINRTFITSSTETRLNFTSLPNTNYTFNVTITDIAGNKNFTHTRTVILDTITPLIEFIAATPENATNTSSTILFVNVSVTELNKNTVLSDIDGTNYTMTCTGTAPDLTCNFTISSLSDGSHNFKVFVNDSAGNVNETERRFITVDTIAPFVDYTGLTAANGTNVSTNYVYVNATSSDVTTGVVNLTFILVNITSGFATELNRTFISTGPNATLNFTSLADGTYLYNVTASDYLGNKNTTERRTLVIDATDPIIDYESPTIADDVNVSRDYVIINVTFTESNFANLTFILVNSTAEINRTFVTSETATLLNFTSLTDDTYQYNVTISDTFGNKAFTTTRSINLDTAIPYRADYQGFTATNGTNVSSDSIYIDVNGADNITGIANFTFILANSTAEVNRTSQVSNIINFTSLTDDTYKFNATLTDYSGNKNFTLTRTITIDATPPLIDFTVDAINNGTFNSIDYITVNVTITETNFANLTFILSNDTAEINRTFVTSSTATRLNFTSLTDINYTFNVTITDIAGNKNFTLTRRVTLDSSTPTVAYTDPTPTNATNTTSNSILINATIADNNPANLTYVLVNSTAEVNRTTITTATSSNYTINFTSLTDDTYRHNVTATDQAGNKEFTLTRILTIDSTNPLVDFVSPTPNNNTNTTSTNVFINVSFTEANRQSTLLNWNGTNFTMTCGSEFCNYSFSSLSDSVNTYYVWQNDTFGNANQTETRLLTIDLTAPVVTLLSPENASTESTTSTIVFTFNVTDANAITNASLILNEILNQTNYTITNNENNTFTLSLANGNYNWSVNATDYAGNIGESLTFALTVNVIEVEPPGPSGPSGGIGGGTGRSFSGFSINREIIKIVLTQGETKIEKLDILNTGGNILDFILNIEFLDEFLALSEDEFRLDRNGIKTVTLAFTASENDGPDVYTGRIIIKSGSLTKIILLIIEIKAKRPLFDIKTEVLERFEEVRRGDDVGAEIVMFNLGDIVPLDINLFYSIRDLDGNDIVFEEETFKVEEQKLIERRLRVPDEIDDGWYLFYAKIDYLGQTAASSSLFRVRGERRDSIYIYALIAILSLLLIYLSRRKIRSLFIEFSAILHKEAALIVKNFTKLRTHRVADIEVKELRKAIKQVQKLIEDAKFIEAKRTILDAKARLYEHMNVVVREENPEIEKRILEIEKELEIFILDEKEIKDAREETFYDFLINLLKKFRK